MQYGREMWRAERCTDKLRLGLWWWWSGETEIIILLYTGNNTNVIPSKLAEWVCLWSIRRYILTSSTLLKSNHSYRLVVQTFALESRRVWHPRGSRVRHLWGQGCSTSMGPGVFNVYGVCNIYGAGDVRQSCGRSKYVWFKNKLRWTMSYPKNCELNPIAC